MAQNQGGYRMAMAEGTLTGPPTIPRANTFSSVSSRKSDTKSSIPSSMGSNVDSIDRSTNDRDDDLDRTNLYIKGLSKDCTQVDLDDIFKEFGVINQSRVYGDGVGFVRFEEASAAEAAIRNLHGKSGISHHASDALTVKYAFRKGKASPRRGQMDRNNRPSPHGSPFMSGRSNSMNHHHHHPHQHQVRTTKNTNNVYLRCLPKGFTDEDLHALCEPFGETQSTRLRDSGVAFVRFNNAADAARAIRELNGRSLTNDGTKLLAKLANSDPFQPKIQSFGGGDRDGGRDGGRKYNDRRGNKHNGRYGRGGGGGPYDSYENEYRGSNRFDYGGQRRDHWDSYDRHPYHPGAPRGGHPHNHPLEGNGMSGNNWNPYHPHHQQPQPPPQQQQRPHQPRPPIIPTLPGNKQTQPSQPREGDPGGGAPGGSGGGAPPMIDDDAIVKMSSAVGETKGGRDQTDQSQQQPPVVGVTRVQSNPLPVTGNGNHQQPFQATPAIPFNQVLFDVNGQQYVQPMATAVPLFNPGASEFSFRSAPSSISSANLHFVNARPPDVAQMSGMTHAIPSAIVVGSTTAAPTPQSGATGMSPLSPGGGNMLAFNMMPMNRPASLHSIHSLPSLPSHSGFGSAASSGPLFVPSVAGGGNFPGMVAPISSNAQTVGTIANPVLFQQIPQATHIQTVAQPQMEQPGQMNQSVNLAAGVANMNLGSPRNNS